MTPRWIHIVFATIWLATTIVFAVSPWDGLVVENEVFIGPDAVFTNDLRLRSLVRRGVYPAGFEVRAQGLAATDTSLTDDAGVFRQDQKRGPDFHPALWCEVWTPSPGAQKCGTTN